jgi:hypothetical protein
MRPVRFVIAAAVAALIGSFRIRDLEEVAREHARGARPNSYQAQALSRRARAAPCWARHSARRRR